MPLPRSIVLSSASLLVAASASAQNVVPATPIAPAAAKPAQAADQTAVEKLSIGDKAPALDIEHWVRGEKMDGFADGKVTVVEFWATWCGPCKASMPHLTELQKQYAEQGVTIIGISDEDVEKVSTFLGTDEWKKKAQYTLVTDPDRSNHNNYMRAAGQRGIPTAFVVDQEGVVAWIGHPMNMDEPLAKIVAGEWDAKAYGAQWAKEQAMSAAWNARSRPFMAASREKDFAKAVAILDEQLAEYPDDLNAKLRRTQILIIELDRAGEALPVAEEMVASSSDPMMLNALSWSVLESGKAKGPVLEMAMEAAQKANELSGGKDGSIIDTLARAYWEAGDAKKAIALQEKAVEISPEGRMKESMKKTLEEYKSGKLSG
ncbi:MAG: redoxin domain-containing protein [Phycisphaerales bacterium]